MIDASPIRIVSAIDSRRVTDWIRFPYKIYPAGSNWVAPLERDLRQKISPKRNPFLKNGAACPFLAIDAKGKVLGRILAHVDFKHLARHSAEVGFFGFFECIDDEKVAKSLIGAAANFVQRYGCKTLRGPFNMSSHQEVGIVLDGFELEQSIADPMTARYYPSLLESTGLSILKRISTFENCALQDFDPEGMLTGKARRLLAQNSFSLRSINIKKFKHELELFRDLYNECFLDNWDFIPRNTEENRFEMMPAKSVLRPELLSVACMYDVPIAFSIALPNVYKLLRPLRGKMSVRGALTVLNGVKKLREAHFMVIGVVPSLRRQGIISVLLYHTMATLKKLGFTSLSTTWVSDDNAGSLAAVNAMKMTQRYRLAIYEKQI